MQEAREKDAEKVAVEQEGEIRRLERALGAAEEAKRALEATLSEVRVQSARLQDNNQELTAAKASLLCPGAFVHCAAVRLTPVRN